MKIILTIDDDEELRKLFRVAFEKEYFTVIEAADGLTGIELARRHQPDLILCDVHMDDWDGFAVLETLRHDPRTSSIPFILMTGLAILDEVKHGLNLGADDFLAKPFSVASLLSSVHNRLEKHFRTQAQAAGARSQLVAMQEITTDLVGIINRDLTRFTYLNQAGRKIFGFGIDDDLSDQPIDELYPPAVWKELYEQGFTTARRDGFWTGEYALRSAANETIIISQLIVGHHRPDGEVEFFSTNARDITRSKRVPSPITSNGEPLVIATPIAQPRNEPVEIVKRAPKAIKKPGPQPGIGEIAAQKLTLIRPRQSTAPETANAAPHVAATKAPPSLRATPASIARLKRLVKPKVLPTPAYLPPM